MRFHFLRKERVPRSVSGLSCEKNCLTQSITLCYSSLRIEMEHFETKFAPDDWGMVRNDVRRFPSLRIKMEDFEIKLLRSD